MLKKTKQNRLKSAVLVAALACTPLFAQAAGLGRITVLSALGQPLKAELEVTANRDELNSLAAKLASADAFRLAGIEYVPALTAMHFSREIKERSGKRYIEITTDRPLNEPFVDMLVELSWASGRLVREYTFLLDPPGLPAPVPAAVVAPEVKATPVAPPAPIVEKAPEPTLPTPVSDVAVTPKPAIAPSRTVTKAPAPVVEKLAPVTSSDRTRLVKPGDTLGRIASEAAPSGVSLDQMLIALFRSNADAFDGNMNRLRAGKILTLPDADAAKSIDATEARKEVLAQSADFNAYRKKLAGMVEAAPEPTAKATRSSGGKIAPKVEDKAPPAASGKDKLEVSRTETTPEAAAKPGGKGPAMQGRLSALEEDIVSRDRALREASGRIAQLERNLGDLKKLAELKSEAGATAQKQAEAAKPVAKPAAETPPAAPVKTPEPVPALAPSPSLSAPPAEAKPESAPPPAAATTDAPKPPPPPKKPVLPPPEPEPEPDFIEENGPLVFGGAGILSLLLGYLGFAAYRRKRQAAAEAAPLTQSELSNNSVFGDAASQSAPVTDLAPSEFSVSESIADTGSSEAVDPLVEADTYLAFGRDAQAEEILLEALKNSPTRHPIHVKLLEIYAARRSPMQFNTLAQELRDQTGGQGNDWERARVLGQSLDPNNTLYLSSEELASAETLVTTAEQLSSAQPVDPDATMVFSAPPPMEPPAAEPEVAVDEVATLDFDLGLDDSAEPASVTAVAQQEPVDTSSGLDFDLDLGEPTAAAPADAAATPDIDLDAPPAEVASSSEAMALDIDFDLDTPAPTAPAMTKATEVEMVVAETAATAQADETMALDIDFDAPAVEAAAPPAADRVAEEANVIDFALDIEVPAAAAEVELPSAVSDLALDLPVEAPAVAAPEPAASPALDFDFDLGEPAAAAPSAVAESAAPAMPLDLSSISLDLDTPAESPSAELPAGDLAAPAMSEASAGEASSQADNPEAATKMELALAYEEMGDRDGARELLEEVVSEGSPAQRELAQAKLDALG